MAEAVDFKYRAFISYSHADTRWARWLHCGPEGLRIGKKLVHRETVAFAQGLEFKRDADSNMTGVSLVEEPNPPTVVATMVTKRLRSMQWYR